MRLTADALRKTVDPASFGFENTGQIERLQGITGQEQAVQVVGGISCKAEEISETRL